MSSRYSHLASEYMPSEEMREHARALLGKQIKLSEGNANQRTLLIGRGIRKGSAIIEYGQFGAIVKSRDIVSKADYVLKTMVPRETGKDKDIHNEIAMLALAQLPFIKGTNMAIMNFLDYGKHEDTYFLLCEYCPHYTLSQKLEKKDLKEYKITRIAFQLCTALEAIHKLGIMHRDVNTNNIMFDYAGNLKLIDFSSATLKFHDPAIMNPEEKASWKATFDRDIAGYTPQLWRSPEMKENLLKLDFPINTASDMWQYGCVLYCMVVGKHPFEDDTNSSMTDPYKYPVDYDQFNNPVIKFMIKECLKRDPSERPKASRLVERMRQSRLIDSDSAQCVKSKKKPNGIQAKPTYESLYYLMGKMTKEGLLSASEMEQVNQVFLKNVPDVAEAPKTKQHFVSMFKQEDGLEDMTDTTTVSDAPLLQTGQSRKPWFRKLF